MKTNLQYLSAVDEIYHYGWSIRKLRRIELLKNSLRHFWPDGHPTRLIHVAGTNGKGSTCRLLEAALDNHGHAGAMINPHLFDYRERFSIRSTWATKDEIAEIWHNCIKPHSLHRAMENPENALTFAESSMLIALHLFDRHALRFGILETGVGGRYAPTMAIDPCLCILTDVGNDHPHTLGNALWQRALEKAGIARVGIPLLTGASGEALEIVQQAALEAQAPFHRIEEQHIIHLREEVSRPELKGLNPHQPSLHFIKNATLALQGAHMLVPEIKVTEALSSMLQSNPLPGRFESPREGLIVDVAHNPDKLRALANQLKATWPKMQFHLIFGISRNRPLAGMIEPLLPLLKSLTFTSASYAGRDPQEVLEEFEALGTGLLARVIFNPTEALKLAEEECHSDDMILITGSAYTIDQALNPDHFMKQINAEFGRRGGSNS